MQRQRRTLSIERMDTNELGRAASGCCWKKGLREKSCLLLYLRMGSVMPPLCLRAITNESFDAIAVRTPEAWVRTRQTNSCRRKLHKEILESIVEPTCRDWPAKESSIEGSSISD